MTYPYPWYYPPLAMLGYLVIVNGIWKIFNLRKKYAKWSLALLVVIALNMLSLAVASAYQMKIQQELIENRIRKQVGLWLKEHVAKNDRVYLECLGYIGFFSNARMLDYPGLATPESIDYIKNKGCDLITLIHELKPEWAILRPGEAELALKQPFFRKNYTYICHFSAEHELEKKGYIPGINFLYHDATFCIYRRRQKQITDPQGGLHHEAEFRK